MWNIKELFNNLLGSSHRKDQALKGRLQAKYRAFQDLLEQNNAVLMHMADMEEKRSGEYLFDRHYLNSRMELLSHGVLRIIESLNVLSLSGDKYRKLYARHVAIMGDIQNVLSRKAVIPVSGLVIPLKDLSKDAVSVAGGKIAHLAEIGNKLDLPVPEGFAITAYAFKRFMEHNGLAERIEAGLLSTDVNDSECLNRMSRDIQEAVIAANIPEDLAQAVTGAVEGLRMQTEAPHRATEVFSVRSSAIHEDGEFSFAGQYATFLHVPAEEVLRKYQEVVASLFTPRAVFYYKTKGFSEEDMVMAVGVLRMIRSKAGGVVYTRDPNDPEQEHVIINAAHGLCKAVVDGAITPESYVVSRHPDSVIIARSPAGQGSMFIAGPAGEIVETPVPEQLRCRQSVSDDAIRTLSRYAREIEDLYGSPQDIEWVLDEEDRLSILQTRPLRTFIPESAPVPTRVAGHQILLAKGVIACKGIASGEAVILKNEDQLGDFPIGGILVAKHTSPRFVTIMNKAAAIITDVGGIAGHMASLSREHRLPTILDAETATTVIKHGQIITVDAVNCNVYDGKVEELLKFAGKKREPFLDTPLFRSLQAALKHVTPLHLFDPADANFTPEACATLHDITRFSHEMAMREMFLTGEDQDPDLAPAVTLKAGIPMAAVLLDIDGGLRESATVIARTEDVISAPFSAFLKGLKAMKWPDPRPADAKGFLSMIAHTASVTEDELRRTARKSFAIVSGNYMNFSIRLGYHFSMVEAYSGDTLNDNYVKFFFKGGGAALDRRLRRVRLIREILQTLDFHVTVSEDVVVAMLPKYRNPAIERTLEILGKFTVYTKQLDMVLYNDAVTDMFIEDFIRDHITPNKRPTSEG